MDEAARLRAIRYSPPPVPERGGFPFSLPALRELGALDLGAPVTLFVGENGSGKSTLLEALAIAAALPTAGSQEARADATLADQRRLAARLELVWTRRLHRGCFLRAEDFFGWVARLRRTRGEVHDELARIDRDPQLAGIAPDDLARLRGAVSSVLSTTYAPDGRDYDHRSHGESFLTFFQARLGGRGLYLLDEPEAALSPQSQLALLVLIREAVAAGSQFVIVTHSPDSDGLSRGAGDLIRPEPAGRRILGRARERAALPLVPGRRPQADALPPPWLGPAPPGNPRKGPSPSGFRSG